MQQVSGVALKVRKMRHAYAMLSIVATGTQAQSVAPVPPPTETRSVVGSDGHRCVAKITGPKPAFRQSLRAIYAMSGEVSEDDQYAAILRHEQYGILNLQLDDKHIVFVDDFTPLTTPAKFAERFRMMCDLEKLARGTLQTIQFYKFRRGEKIRPPTPAEIEAITRKRSEHVQQQTEAARRLPDKSELEALFRREWSVAGPYPSLETSFGAESSIFGEIHDLLCDRDKELFRCVIGATFLHFGKPEYEQRTVFFKRDSQDCCELQRYEEQGHDDGDIVVDRAPERSPVSRKVLEFFAAKPVL